MDYCTKCFCSEKIRIYKLAIEVDGHLIILNGKDTVHCFLLIFNMICKRFNVKFLDNNILLVGIYSEMCIEYFYFSFLICLSDDNQMFLHA